MKKQKRKNLNRILLISAVVILIFIVFMLSTKQTVVILDENSQSYPLQTGTFNLGEYSGTYETPYLGELTSGSYVINGDNDGDVSVSNSISGGNVLQLSSSLSSQDSSTDNYMKTKITLPKGKLNINYNYNLYSYYPQESRINFKVGNIEKSFISPSSRPASISDSGSFELILDKEETINIEIISSGIGDKYSSQGSLTISFEPELIPEEPKIYYRLSNNDCSQINILPSEKTSNDYSTLTECQSKIETDDETIPGDNDEPVQDSKINIIGIFITIAILILLIIIIRNLIKNKKKRK